MNQEQYKEMMYRAVRLGAKKCLAYTTNKNTWKAGGFVIEKKVFAYYFFDASGYEIAFQIVGSPMKVLDYPRTWGKDFLNHPDYQEIKI